MKRKVCTILLFVIILIGIILFLIFNRPEKNDNVNKLNNNENVIRVQNLENLTIEKASIATDKNNKSTFSAEIINNSDVPNTFESIEIIIKDKNNNIMTTLYAYVGILNKGDITKINVESGMNINSAYSVEYRVSK